MPTPSSAVAVSVCPLRIFAAAAGAVNAVAANVVSFLIVKVVVALLPDPSVPVSVCVCAAAAYAAFTAVQPYAVEVNGVETVFSVCAKLPDAIAGNCTVEAPEPPVSLSGCVTVNALAHATVDGL